MRNLIALAVIAAGLALAVIPERQDVFGRTLKPCPPHCGDHMTWMFY